MLVSIRAVFNLLSEVVLNFGSLASPLALLHPVKNPQDARCDPAVVLHEPW